MSTSTAERNTQLRDGKLSNMLTFGIRKSMPSIFDSGWFGPKGSTRNKYQPHQGKNVQNQTPHQQSA